MALRFDNSADYLERTTNIPSRTSHTIMAWIKQTTDTNNWATFIRLAESPGSANFTLSAGFSDPVFSIYNGSTQDTGTTLTVGTWYHIAQVGDGSNVSGYLNGVLDVQVGQNSLTFGRLQLGNASEFNEFLDGCMPAIKIYDVALTADEIAAEMLQYAPIRLDNLNSWIPGIDVSTTDAVKDYSGLGRDFTINGTLAIEDGPPIPWQVVSVLPLLYALDAAPPGADILQEDGSTRITLEGGAGFLIMEETEAGGTTFFMTPSGTITPAGALLKQANKILAGTITPTGALIKQDQK